MGVRHGCDYKVSTMFNSAGTAYQCNFHGVNFSLAIQEWAKRSKAFGPYKRWIRWRRWGSLFLIFKRTVRENGFTHFGRKTLLDEVEKYAAIGAPTLTIFGEQSAVGFGFGGISEGMTRKVCSGMAN